MKFKAELYESIQFFAELIRIPLSHLERLKAVDVSALPPMFKLGL